MLLVTIGPVQEFIAQARRTRDLWYGSHLLSELSRAAARELIAAGAQLVFPALDQDDPELSACPGPLRANKSAPLSIANKLVAVVPESIDPEALAQSVREAVNEFWRNVTTDVQMSCKRILDPQAAEVWREQVETFIEFAAAWVMLSESYLDSRRKVERAIAGRKNLRDFGAWNHSRGSVRKSSLDGARETVLLPARRRDAALAARYRIAGGEDLDAVGLVKRAGGVPSQFVPIVNIAFASFLAVASEVAPRELNSLRQAAREVGLSRVDRVLPSVRPFPFDASILLESRWKPVFSEQGAVEKPPQDADVWGNTHVRPLLRVFSQPPYPYVACLVADGDHVGRALDEFTTLDAHRSFSRALSTFANEARTIVEQRHSGSLVYAGGDDVLAFLPLPEALQCADALRRRFDSAMGVACAPVTRDKWPTLSVGVGIGHVLESLGDLLALGRAAEVYAKRGGLDGADRNALAVIVDKRSGGIRRWRARWGDWNDDPGRRLREDAVLLGERFSVRKVYEVAQILARLPKPAEGASPRWAQMLHGEVARAFDRATAGNDTATPEELGLILPAEAPYGLLYNAVESWIDRLLIARVFANADPSVIVKMKVGAA